MQPFRKLLPFALIFAAALALRADTLLVSSMDWDESVYFLMAESIAEGQPPYTTVWDHKPPVIYGVYLVSHVLFDRAVLGVRLLSCLAVAFAAWLAARLYRRLQGGEGWLEPAAVAVLVLFAFRAYGGTAANTEVFFAPFIAAFVLLLLEGGQLELDTARRLRTLALAGACAGVAFWIKVNTAIDMALSGAAALLVLSARLPRAVLQRGVLAVAAGFVFASVVLLSPFFGWGLDLLIESVVEANARHVGERPPLARTLEYVGSLFIELPALWLLAIAGVVMMLRGAARVRPELWVIAAWLLGAALATLAPGQPYPHYAIETLVPLSLLSALALKQLVERYAPGARQSVIAFGVVIAVTAGLAPLTIPRVFLWHVRELVSGRSADTPQNVARYLRAQTASGKPPTVYVLDWEPILYYLLNTDSPTRYPFPPFLLDPRFVHVAQIDASKEIDRILALRPDFVVRRATPWPELAPQRALIDVKVARDYAMATTIEGVEILRAKP